MKIQGMEENDFLAGAPKVTVLDKIATIAQDARIKGERYYDHGEWNDAIELFQETLAYIVELIEHETA